jgi:hypothetical protein
MISLAKKEKALSKYLDRAFPDNFKRNVQKSSTWICRIRHCRRECRSFKEVIHPHLPVRVPCYDLVPLTPLTFGRSFLAVRPRTSGEDNSGDLTGGVYKTRERIQRSIADLRLLAIPPSCSRVADCNLNWGRIFGICSTSRYCCPLVRPL